MERVCFLLKVKSDMIDEYKRIHKKAWPEMLELLKKSGFHNYSLFIREDGLLVGYFETMDWGDTLKTIAASDINTRWQKLTSPFFETGSGDPAAGQLMRLEEVFHNE